MNQNKKIFIIEDNKIVSEFYKDALNGLGYTDKYCEVSIYENGESGLKHYSEKRPVDFVILDNDLPDMKGVDILKKINLDFIRDENGKIPLILASGNLSPEVTLYAESIGAYALQKPVRLEQLEEILEKHLGNPAEITQHK